MKIKRPGNIFGKTEVSVEWFYDWFDQCVEPVNKMLSEAVEVVSFSPWAGANYTWMDRGDYKKCDIKEDIHHKALLINIEPIKKETAEDILRDILEDSYIGENYNDIYNDLKKRAKKVLEK